MGAFIISQKRDSGSMSHSKHNFSAFQYTHNQRRLKKGLHLSLWKFAWKTFENADSRHKNVYYMYTCINTPNVHVLYMQAL